MPSTWSPSTTRPAASTAIRRSASPSRANPASAPAARTAAARLAGAVAPDSTLMLMPSGSAWMTSTVAPVAARMRGATAEPDPFAASSTSRSPSARTAPGQPEPVLDVAVQQRRPVDHPAELAVRRPGQLLGPPDQLLELVLDRVVELEPVAVEDLEPVVGRRVVRGRDHDPGRERAAPRDEREGRRGHDADDVDVGAEAGRPGRQGGHEHVARAARVLADDDRTAAADQPRRHGPPERVGDGRLEVDVGHATDAVRAEQAGHRSAARRGGRGRAGHRRGCRGGRDRHPDLGRTGRHERGARRAGSP